jgi:hypothetical protein
MATDYCTGCWPEGLYDVRLSECHIVHHPAIFWLQRIKPVLLGINFGKNPVNFECFVPFYWQ